MDTVLLLAGAAAGYMFWNADMTAYRERNEQQNRNGAMVELDSGMTIGRGDFLGNNAYEQIGPNREYTGNIALPQPDNYDKMLDTSVRDMMARLAVDADFRQDENVSKQVEARENDAFSVLDTGEFKRDWSATQFNEALDEKQGASDSRRRRIINRDLILQTKANQ